MAQMKMTLLDLCRIAEKAKTECNHDRACQEGVNRMVKALTGRSCPVGLSGKKKKKRGSWY